MNTRRGGSSDTGTEGLGAIQQNRDFLALVCPSVATQKIRQENTCIVIDLVHMRSAYTIFHSVEGCLRIQKASELLATGVRFPRFLVVWEELFPKLHHCQPFRLRVAESPLTHCCAVPLTDTRH